MAAPVPSSRKSRFYTTAVLLIVFAIDLNTFLCSAADTDKEKEIAFQAILQRMEQKVLALRDEFERVYQFRCDTNTLDQCGRNNYNDCYSSYPDAECAAGDEYFEIKCENGETCPASWDIKRTKVTIPDSLALGPDGNPTDPEIIESVCYTRLSDPFLLDNYEDDENFWSQYGLPASWTYFGAHNGMFRMLPASREECYGYDPRRRPWFVAASSGPKDLVLVLDTSGSMNDYGRLDLLKEAAITVIETLSVADKVAIVTFSTDASVLNGQNMLIRATKENKDKLIDTVNQINANGSTNFHAAFTETFSLLDLTFQNESTTGCNVAVLFMTDGKITTGPGHEEVIELVNTKVKEYKTDYDRTMTVFSFSLGRDADEIVSKSIACSTNGIWIPVEESKAYGNDITTAMASYYKLYALGLGDSANEDFVAWVQPYEFYSRKRMGTTVSAPVYDRSVTPHLLLGVVGTDAYMDAFAEIIGEDASSSDMLQRFINLSTARCPKIELTECELDALRFLGSGERATCGVCNKTGYPGIVPQKCAFQSDWPNQLWANTDMKGKSYAEKACCEAGFKDPPDVCTPSTNAVGVKSASKSKSPNVVAIVGGAVAAAFLLACVLVSVNKRVRKRSKHRSTQNNAAPSTVEPNLTSPERQNELPHRSENEEPQSQRSQLMSNHSIDHSSSHIISTNDLTQDVASTSTRDVASIQTLEESHLSPSVHLSNHITYQNEYKGDIPIATKVDEIPTVPPYNPDLESPSVQNFVTPSPEPSSPAHRIK
mmetsp:Transcript_24982/g.51235  ORF Transcript_24982/g.51235 Transcript_24982/m.51235 type:complete len:770 (-) Transcript_24982:208-2517(-)